MPVIYNKKVEYAYTDPGVKAHTLSWAEYQALSEDDKMNGDLYFIPDKQPEGNPSRIWTKLGTDPLTTQADDVSGAVNELNSSLANTITAYGKGTYRLTAISNLYGYITSSGNNLYLSIPINIKPEVNSISISELLLGLRIMPGGYAGGADNFNALSYISAAGISKTQNMIMIYLSKSNGWGATNNTPTIGSGTITFTLS